MPELEQKPDGSSLVQGAGDVRRPPRAAPGKQPLTASNGAPSSSRLLVPDTSQPAPGSSILVPDANHPARRDADGDQVIQTNETIEPGKAAALRSGSWKSLGQVSESINLEDDSGDTLHVDITYRLESRPAELSEVPDIWVHTERKALFRAGSGEHVGATIVGQARINLAPGEARDPKAAIAKASLGADHWAQVYLAEAAQYVHLHGTGGRPTLLADAADNDVLAYNDPLRTLVGLRNLLKQQHVAGHGAAVKQAHAQAQRLLANAKRGRALLEREIAAIASSHDPHPGRVAPVRFLVSDIESWLSTNERAGRDDTEDARQLRVAASELERLLAAVDDTHPAKRDQVDDALGAPVRLVERTAQGIGETGEMIVDAVVLGIDAICQALGIGSFDYHPISTYGRAIEATGASTTTAMVGLVNGFANDWSDALERAKHGDYRQLTDVSIDTLLMIDGARGGGVVALDQAEALAAKLGSVGKSARAVASGLAADALDFAALVGQVPGEVRNIAAAMADGADAFAARLQAGGVQMATAGDGGSGPRVGGLSVDTLTEAAQAAKEAYEETRRTQKTTNGADEAAQQVAKSAAGNAETSATKKYIFGESEKATVEKRTRDVALAAAEKAYKDSIASGELPAKANTAANKAAKDAAEDAAKSEALRSAKEAAQRAIDSGSVIDMQEIDSKTKTQLADFNAGKSGGKAVRLARELDGVSEKEFLTKMGSEPCTMKAVNIAGPPPQSMYVYEYLDGTVVRYKPLGDAKRPGPTYSIELKKDLSTPDRGKNDAAFKVDSSGKAVPKGPAEAMNPYPPGSLQADTFRDEVMNAGHKTLGGGDHG
jgi:hypothetical protein